MSDTSDPWGGGGEGFDNSKSSKKFVDSQICGFFEGLRAALGGLPNGSGGYTFKFSHVFLGIAGVLVLYACTGFYVVNPEEKAVELTFGKFRQVTGPGLRYWLPRPVGRVLKVKVEVISKEEVGASHRGDSGHGEGIMLTGDENIVNINFDVQWRVADAYNYLFSVRDVRPGATVKNAAESAMREIIGKSTLAFAIEGEGRAAIAYETKKLLQSILDQYRMGVEVLSIQLKKVDPPEKVISAFRDVQSARADKERTINEAHAYRNEVLPRAKGEAIRIKLDAEAYKSEVVNRAEGDVAKFVALYQEYVNQPAAVRNRMYIETMEEVLSNMDKILVTDDVKGLLSWLPANGQVKLGGK
ncbi:MAG: FtsH protease activity modulator HflK [Anaplasma sp.]